MTLTSDRWQRVQELFDAALERSGEERSSYLAAECGDDRELLEDVESLLAHDTQAEADFMRPANRDRELPEARESPEEDPFIGTTVGRFHIQTRIASGGMGIVYEAVQDAPRRTVALKIMRRGIPSRSALRRFEYEAQIMGRLRHPGIAQIFEAGVHDASGARVPYFAMEYIPEARDILEYAEDEKLDIRRRLALFAQVCDAVNHGHQRGIIHRDLKPANILVDSTGDPKVIDFGVARATESDLAMTTVQTNIGQLVGTVQYMSPEQCTADPNDLDVRSDVYSLGVVLYELLSGKLPYQTSTTNVLDATKTIREVEPARLSRFDRKLKGDIETIALKALEKDRDRRYQTAGELRVDLIRFLDNEPILARPSGMAYTLIRFVQRRTWQAVAMGVGFCAIVAAVAAISSQSALSKAEIAKQRSAVVAYGARLGEAAMAIIANDPAAALRILDAQRTESPDWEWSHLRSRVDQSVYTLFEAGSRISSFAVDANGDRLRVAVPLKVLGCVRVYDESGDLIREIDAFAPQWVAFNGDGSLLAVSSTVGPATVDNRSLISIWDLGASVENGPLLQWIANPIGAVAIAFHPHLPIVASGSSDGAVYLWDLDDMPVCQPGQHLDLEPSAVLRGHDWQVKCIKFSADGDHLATGAHDYTVRIWDVPKSLETRRGHELAVLRGHTDYVESVAFSPDGQRLASASMDETIRLWDVPASIEQAAGARDAHEQVRAAEGVQVGLLTEHTAGVLTVAFDATATYLVSGGADNVIRVWNVKEDATIPDLRRTQVWLKPSRRQISVLRGHSSQVHQVAFLPDGRILSASQNGSAKIWLPRVVDVPRLRGHGTSVNSVAFTPDGKHILSGDGMGCLTVWDANRCARVARRFLRDAETVSDLTLVRKGDRLYAIGAVAQSLRDPVGGRIVIWDVEDPGAPRRVTVIEDDDDVSTPFISLTVSADARRLAAGDRLGVTRVWDIGDLSNPKLVLRLAGQDQQVSGVVFLDEKGDWLAVAEGRPPDGESYENYAIRVLDVPNRSEVERIEAHRGPIRALVGDAMRKQLASASTDTSVRVWAVDWSSTVPHLEIRGVLAGHTSTVLSLVFHPTEQRLFSGAADGRVKVWDTKWLTEVATLREHIGAVNDLAFSPDGVRMASASAGFFGSDNVVRLWEAPQWPDESREAKLRQRSTQLLAEATVRMVFEAPLSSLDEAMARIKADQSLSEDVRTRVIGDFNNFVPRPDWLDRRAWNAIDDPEPTVEQLREGLYWARQAATLAPENGDYLASVGIIEYRLDRHDDALVTLIKSTESSNPRLALAWSAIAMIHHRRGQIELADKAMARATDDLKLAHCAGRAENHRFVKEARAMLGEDDKNSGTGDKAMERE